MTSTEIRAVQHGAIVEFLWDAGFRGRVLDYGCGIAPYREIVEASAEWHGYNRAIYPGGARINIGPDDPLGFKWDVILCTQMLQYVPDVLGLLGAFRAATSKLVLTYATNWPEVEVSDLHRFTRAGMEALLDEWKILRHHPIVQLPFGDQEHIALGYGVVAV